MARLLCTTTAMITLLIFLIHTVSSTSQPEQEITNTPAYFPNAEPCMCASKHQGFFCGSRAVGGGFVIENLIGDCLPSALYYCNGKRVAMEVTTCDECMYDDGDYPGPGADYCHYDER